MAITVIVIESPRRL